MVDSANGEIILGTGAAGGAVKTGAPLRASIFKSNVGDLYLFARKVTVQPFERLVVKNGSLIAIADGTTPDLFGVTMSNTAVSNYLVLVSTTKDAQTPGIFLRSRGPALVQDSSTTTKMDQGTDLIGGAVLFFNTNYSNPGPFPPRTLYAPAPAAAGSAGFFDYTIFTGNIQSFAGLNTIDIKPDGAGVTNNVFVADLLVTNSFRPTRPNLVYLDLSTVPGAGAGPFIDPSANLFGLTSELPLRQLSSGNAAPRTVLQQAFTPNVPREDTDTAPPELALSPADWEQLQALGIYARAAGDRSISGGAG